MKTIRIKTGNQDMESLPTTSHSNTPKISKNCSGIPCQPFLSANVKVVCAAFRDFDQTPRIFFGGDPGWKPAGLQQHISSRDSHQGFLSNPVAYYLPPKRVIINVFTNEKMWKMVKMHEQCMKRLTNITATAVSRTMRSFLATLSGYGSDSVVFDPTAARHRDMGMRQNYKELTHEIGNIMADVFIRQSIWHSM